MRLEWNALALADRRAIYDYVEQDDPRAAARLDERIGASVTRLRDFPESGRPGRVEGTRELVVGGAPYVIPYRIEADMVELLRVLHSAQLWPGSFGADKEHD